MDIKFLKLAETLARESAEPTKCGAIIVDKKGTVIAQAFNSQRLDGITVNHAEIKAITLANGKVGRKLKGLTIYCSCEPCTLCLSALKFADIDRIVFASKMVDVAKGRELYKVKIDSFKFLSCFPDPPELEYMPLR